MHEGVTTFRRTGAGVGYAGQLTMLSHAYALAGQVEAGLAALDEALGWIKTTGICVIEAEIHRLRGELLLIGKPARWQPRYAATLAAAEECFRQAIAVASHQGARWLELRAATSLCSLLEEQNAGFPEKLAAARQTLANVYDSFSEGFDTDDMRKARQLLDELVAA
jgi:adenylate cyclase